MPTFNAAGDDAVRRALNLARLTGDAQRAGYRCETVWIVTDLKPRDVTFDSATMIASIPVHAARAPRGTHGWGSYDVGEAFSDLFDGGARYGDHVQVSTCQVSHHGAPCPGPCEHPERR